MLVVPLLNTIKYNYLLQDYRFMPEPNLPPLHLNTFIENSSNHTCFNVDIWKNNLPELPATTRERLVNEYKISFVHALILVVSIACKVKLPFFNLFMLIYFFRMIHLF